MAYRVAALRDLTPNLAYTDRRWASTVLVLTPSSSASCRLVRPLVTRRRISTSREVSPSVLDRLGTIASA